MFTNASDHTTYKCSIGFLEGLQDRYYNDSYKKIDGYDEG